MAGRKAGVGMMVVGSSKENWGGGEGSGLD